MAFKKAQRKNLRLRLAFAGPSGSGKTYTALLVACGIAKEGERIAVLDTEEDSACYYADDMPASFDVDSDWRDGTGRNDYGPERLMQKMNDAAREGYDVLVIDSLSHAWAAEGGALEMVDRAAKGRRGGNSFAGWVDVTPVQQRLMRAILAYPGHVIVTMRVKTEWDIQEQNGRKTPVKIGLSPIQGKGIEYEFTAVLDLIDEGALATISKTRCSALAKSYDKPGPELGRFLRDWADGGVEPRASISIEIPRPTVEEKTLMREARDVLGDKCHALIEELGLPAASERTPQDWDLLIKRLGEEMRDQGRKLAIRDRWLRGNRPPANRGGRVSCAQSAGSGRL